MVHRIPINTRTLVFRKTILVFVVLILTTFNLYFRGHSKNAINGDNNQEQQQQQQRLLSLDETINLEDSINKVKNDYGDNQSNGPRYFGRKLRAEKWPKKTITNETKVSLNSTKSTEQKSGNKTQTSGRKPKTRVLIPLLPPKVNVCTNPAYTEFPPDIFGNRVRARGAIVVHILIVLYMFYCLAVVCDHYFLPSLEECSQRLNLSDDVAGATFMAAGSSAPELFTAILGVFIAKGDVGTGTIVGSAVFNILFVIGLCSLYTASTELNWWPVARDSTYYTFTVLVLIMCIYDGEVTTFESFLLLSLYGVYILIMNNNLMLRDFVFEKWQLYFPRKTLDEMNNLNTTVANVVHYRSFEANDIETNNTGTNPFETRNPFIVRKPEVSLFEAANQVIIKHKRLFRAITRFRAAAHLIIIRNAKAKEKKQRFAEDRHRLTSIESRRMSRIGPDESFWRRVPDPNVDHWQVCLKWLVVAPLHAALFYTIPDCKAKSNLFLVTFLASITWTAIFSYIMVWMVTVIGYTLGIPDSIMGITFLAAGTSVPDAYASIHVAKMGQADMAVSNSIGSNVFDILVGLALPWFIETAIVDPSSVSSINSQGLIYAVILLFLSLLITIYLFHRNHWTLNPKLGHSLLITYAIFLVISSALEFNLLGNVNPPMCDE